MPFRRSRRPDPVESGPDAPSAPLRPSREWAGLGPTATVLPRQPRGVVPHQVFRTRLSTSWSAPPALQPLGHDFTTEAPTGLLTATAVPVEAYAGAELRFTPHLPDADDRASVPEPARPRLLDRVLRRPAAVPSPAPQPPLTLPPPLTSAPLAVRPRDAGFEDPAVLLPAEQRPVLSRVPDQQLAPTVDRPLVHPAVDRALDGDDDGGVQDDLVARVTPIDEVTPVAPELPADAGAAGPMPAEQPDPSPTALDDPPALAGPPRADAPASGVRRRSVIGHRPLGADLMAAAAAVALPHPVAALTPVALPAPVAGRAGAAPGLDHAGEPAGPPRPAGGWARPMAGYGTPPATPTAPPPAMSAEPGLATSVSRRQPDRPAAALGPAAAVEPDVTAASPGPVEPAPGLPDWWPTDSTSWDISDAGPGSEPVDQVADLGERLGADRFGAAPAVADVPPRGIDSPAADQLSGTEGPPMLRQRIRPTRDPATGAPVTRRVAWPLDPPTAAQLDPSGEEPGAEPAPDRLDDATGDGPGAAPPRPAAPEPLGPVLRRVVRTPAPSPYDELPSRQVDDRPELTDLAGLLALDQRATHETSPPAEPAADAADAGADDSAQAAAPAPAAATRRAAAAGQDSAPTADELAQRLRHTLLVERERFGVLADLW